MLDRKITKSNDALFFLKQQNKTPDHVKDLKNVHKNIKNVINKETDCNSIIQEVKSIIESSEQLIKYSNYQHEFDLEKVDSNKRQQEIKNKSHIFFDELNKMDNAKLKELTMYSDDEILSLFFTYIGVKPSCIISKDLIKNIYSECNIFKDLECLENVVSNNPKQKMVFRPGELVKTVKKNEDVFGNLKDIDQITRYLKNNNLATHIFLDENVDKQKFYNDNLRTGLLLGVPKTEAIKFSAYQPYIHDYIELLYYICGNFTEPKDNDTFEQRKLSRFNTLKEYKVQRNGSMMNIPKEIVNILSEFGIVRAVDGIEKYAYYRYGFDPVNIKYKEFFDKIINITEFEKNFYDLGRKKA